MIHEMQSELSGVMRRWKERVCVCDVVGFEEMFRTNIKNKIVNNVKSLLSNLWTTRRQGRWRWFGHDINRGMRGIDIYQSGRILAVLVLLRGHRWTTVALEHRRTTWGAGKLQELLRVTFVLVPRSDTL